jgi:hypothetical protein
MVAVPALSAFRDHLFRAASLDLERLDTVWVGTVRAAQHDESVRRAGKPVPNYDSARLVPYRKLLTLVLEMELYLRRYEGVDRLLRASPDAAMLGALGLTDDDWAWLLLQQFVVASQGLVDRTDRIINTSVELLIGSYDQDGVASEMRRLQETVGRMRQHMDMFRGAIAHGATNPAEAGWVGLLLESDFWDVSIALGEFPSLERFLPYTDSDPQTAIYRSEMCLGNMAVVMEGLEQSFRDLDAAIDWSRVRAV